MENISGHLQPKTFGKIQYGTMVIWILIGVLFLGVFAEMDINEFKNDFHCGGAKRENIDLIRGECYEKYEKQYNKLAFPVYAFVITNFVLIISVCVIYSRLVTPTVNRLSRSIRNGDPEKQSRDQGNALSTGYKLFKAYCSQLLIRLVLGVIFIILQTQWLYPLKFSSKFHCNLTDRTTQPWNSSDNAQHSTSYDCHNQRAVKKNSWMNAVLVVNGIFVAGIMIEIVYISFRACRKRDFMQNSKFQTSHLNPPEEPREQESNENILLLRSEPEQLLKLPLQKFIENTKKMIRDDTYQPSQLRSLFSSSKHLTLDQIYTNLVVVPDMAKYDFTEDRWKNLEIYTRSVERNETPRGPEDILNHGNKKILIIGRPGIGKTLYCTKILSDWAFDKAFDKTPDNKVYFEAAFFVKLRKFNAATGPLTLRELLTRSTYSPRNDLDEDVWNYILENPQRVLFIFDGIDEFKFNSEITTEDTDPQFRNSVDDKMPIFALYAKLTTGKLLNGAAVLTTTRPSALPCIKSIPFDKAFEILGFSSKQVEEYVTKFSEKDKEAGETLKQHITSNINILSLCYIPASCFIICSSLFNTVKSYGSKSLDLPTRLTDVYEEAVKIFYFRYNKKCHNDPSTTTDIKSKDLPPNVEKELEKVAFEGIKEGRLIFGENEVRGMEDSALFYRLSDREPDPSNREEQFCFIHLTMQEFFAARHLANTTETELRNFVSKNITNGKWQLVFQFLAGLMKDKVHLPSELITDLLPVKTEEEESARYNAEQWTENEEKRKVTCWPTKDEQDLAVTLIKCVNENSSVKLEVQKKLQQINFNFMNFTACHLTAVDCSSLVNVINIHQTSHLDLSFNNLGPLGCYEICKLLKCRESQLSWLDLTNNQLTDKAAEYLAKAINNNNCQLRTLNLIDNNISHIGAQHLAEAINNSNCQLHTLDLSQNNISDTGAQHLAEAINNNNCQLRTLELSQNNISDTGAQRLAEAINNNNCQLRTLNLTVNNISKIGAQYLAKAIENNNCQLRTLNLATNNISYIGAKHFAKAINNKNCQLHTLDLSYNTISHIGAQHLAEAINNNNCQLHTLKLSFNNILDIGAEHLAKAINNNNCQLRMLDLSFNNISHIGAQHLATAIKNNCQLHTLKLSFNNILDIGAEYLAKAINNNNNCQLRTLYLTDNTISDTGAHHLVEAINNNKCQLRMLDLSDNKNITDAGKQKARNLLSNSQSKCELIL